MIQKRMVFVLAFVLYFIHLGTTAFAVNSEGSVLVETEPSSVVMDIEFLTQKPTNDHVECFDVKEDGMLAVGTSESNKKTVCVFDSSGVFQYGYRFVSFGNFYLDWSGEHLVLCLTRSSLAVTVDSSGMVARVDEIKNTKSNDRYWRFLQSRTRMVNEEKYMMHSSKIQKVDAAGEKETLYQVSPLYTIKRLAIISAISAIVVGGLWLWFKWVREILLENKENS